MRLLLLLALGCGNDLEYRNKRTVRPTPTPMCKTDELKYNDCETWICSKGESWKKIANDCDCQFVTWEDVRPQLASCTSCHQYYSDYYWTMAMIDVALVKVWGGHYHIPDFYTVQKWATQGRFYECPSTY